MPQATVEEFIDTSESREELVAFLHATGPLGQPSDWRLRLAHWWDANPHKDLLSNRGFVVREAQRMVGFVGGIPQAYRVGGDGVPALLGTTFRVLPGYEQSVARILLSMRQLAQRIPFVYTTPLRRLQSVIRKMGAREERHTIRRLYPTGRLARVSAYGRWPSLESHRQCVTDLRKVRALATVETVECHFAKAVSLSNLAWQLASPVHHFAFLGSVDSQGVLHSYLILRSRTVMRLFPAWEIMESWTARSDRTELQALAGHLALHPDVLGRPHHWLSSVSFPTDPTWTETQSLLTHHEEVCHYYLLPRALREVPLFPMLAEGDLVL